ncbi:MULTISPECIES: hypothetical protein [Carnobacterium]|uniref:hypothetical protein n=1 Tax=Carnobacterium TaxID=2747 RepID=UPI000D4C15E9|nr:MULTISPECIES: hypothetical protein [Carnobacterium]MCO6018153.1 hypothetical protein [Carnobacterium divergens]MDT1938490.1 hypothetical protein [Carnobacterium divergens]MDT1940928.1 hypothetical protein [Carnobacterium divergens]MDT1946726.1 hypothetical protein [Carnobacterium divergens]MDT1949163.1 hypothetical protein [Carnobacterium divergens]
MKKNLLLSVLFMAILSVGGLLINNQATKAAPLVEDFTFEASAPNLAKYHLVDMWSSKVEFKGNRLTVTDGRVGNTVELPVNHKYKVTLKKAQGKLTIFGGILDVKSFDLANQETVDYSFVLQKGSIEGPKTAKISFGSYGTSSFSGYTIEQLN